MAIDRTGISSLDTGASDITYTGNEGPKSPQEEQQMMMAQLEQEYEQYRMEQMEIDPSKVLSFQDWYQATYEASRQGVASGGIARLGYQWGGPGGKSPGHSQGPAGGATGGGGGYSDAERHARQNVGGPPGITTAPTHIPTTPPAPVTTGGASPFDYTRPPVTPVTTGGASPFAYTRQPTGITSNYMNPTFRKATIDFLKRQKFANKPKSWIGNLQNLYGEENIQQAGYIADLKSMTTKELIQMNNDQISQGSGDPNIENILAERGYSVVGQREGKGMYNPVEKKVEKAGTDYSDIFGGMYETKEDIQQSKDFMDAMGHLKHGWSGTKLSQDEATKSLTESFQAKPDYYEDKFGFGKEKNLKEAIDLGWKSARLPGQTAFTAAEGGIARLGYANGQLVQPGPGRPGYQGPLYAAPPSGPPRGPVGGGGYSDAERYASQQQAASTPTQVSTAGGPPRELGTTPFKPGSTEVFTPEEWEKEKTRQELARLALRTAEDKEAEDTEVLDVKYALDKDKPSFPSMLMGLGPKAYLPGGRKKAIADRRAYAKSIGWGDWFDSFSEEEQISTDMMNFLAYSDAVPEGKTYADYAAERGSPGLKESGNVGNLGDRFIKKDKFGNVMKDPITGDILYDYMPDPTGGEGPIYYPGYLPGGIPSAAPGGITETAAATTPATTATTPPEGWNPLYHIGGGATQEQIDYMQNVLGMAPGQTYMAQGGRVPAAFGGVMGSDRRKRYGLGSIFKKAKKFLKSDTGKMALMAAIGIGGPKWLQGMGLETSGKWLGKEGVFKALGSSFMKNPMPWIAGLSGLGYATAEEEEEDPYSRDAELAEWEKQFAGLGQAARPWYSTAAQGGRIGAQEGGLMDLGGMEKDYRQEGGFVPLGGEERADDVPARLSKNEFVFTADAVRAAGGGDIDAGAEVMENVMENLEQGGQVSEESQGLEGARDMFATSQRLEGVL